MLIHLGVLDLSESSLAPLFPGAQSSETITTLLKAEPPDDFAAPSEFPDGPLLEASTLRPYGPALAYWAFITTERCGLYLKSRRAGCMRADSSARTCARLCAFGRFDLGGSGRLAVEYSERQARLPSSA